MNAEHQPRSTRDLDSSITRADARYRRQLTPSLAGLTRRRAHRMEARSVVPRQELSSRIMATAEAFDRADVRATSAALPASLHMVASA